MIDEAEILFPWTGVGVCLTNLSSALASAPPGELVKVAMPLFCDEMSTADPDWYCSRPRTWPRPSKQKIHISTIGRHDYQARRGTCFQTLGE